MPLSGWLRPRAHDEKRPVLFGGRGASLCLGTVRICASVAKVARLEGMRRIARRLPAESIIVAAAGPLFTVAMWGLVSRLAAMVIGIAFFGLFLIVFGSLFTATAAVVHHADREERAIKAIAAGRARRELTR